MGQYATEDELNGLLKDVYGENGPVNLIPEVAHYYKDVKLKDAERQGDAFIQNIILSRSHGFTYNTTSKSPFDLNDDISMTTGEAKVSASEVTLKQGLPLRLASRSSGGNKKAFKDGTELVMEDMMESHVFRLECAYLYGQSAEGLAETASSSNVSGTATDITLTEGSFADGIFSGLENAKVQWYTAAGVLVSSGADSVFQITRVDSETRTIRVVGTTTGITALDTAIGNAAHFMFFQGAEGEECVGLHKILKNTGSLFGIDAAVYGLWRANSVDCGDAAITMAKVLKGAGKAYGRGLRGKARLDLNPKAWANLASDLAALRRYDGSYKRTKAENGAEAICYYAQNGEIEIVGHPMVKPKDAFLLPVNRLKRLGSTDITFNLPGVGGKMLRLLENKNGFELRNYSDTCIFLNTPAQAVLFENIKIVN